MMRRIAMWSGPRNISTALMRAFENRPDTQVWDEPFYGYYLHRTGVAHPGAEDIILDQGTNWQEIARRCITPLPGGTPVFYQKQMTMHLLPEVGREWICALDNGFLIRRPDRVIASYAKIRADMTFEDVGFRQQADLFEYVQNNTPRLPLVVDSQDFLMNPEPMLKAICEHFDIPYWTEMLSWPPGPRDSDGVWGKHWYDQVWKSTTFEPYRESRPTLDPALRAIAEESEPYYQRLYRHRLTI